MTSEQTMLNGAGTLARSIFAALLVTLLALFAGACAGDADALAEPREHTAPYDAAAGEAVWVVLPLRNESGTSLADPLAVSDALVNAAEQVRGVRAVPMNRTLRAIRDLELDETLSPNDVGRLARHLGAHAVVTGSITAYDPYTPLLGLALAVYPGVGGIMGPEVDPEALARQVREGGLQRGAAAPVSVVSETLDGKNQGVQASVKAYAEGRSDPASALGWRRYLASMDLFTEFASWRLVGALLEREWARVGNAAAEAGAEGTDR